MPWGVLVRAAVLAVGVAGAAWLVSEALSPGLENPDFLIEPWMVLDRRRNWIAGVAATALVGVCLLSLHDVRRGRPPSLSVLGPAAGIGAVIGGGYAAITAPSIGANIGGGLVVIVGPVALIRLGLVLSRGLSAERLRAEQVTDRELQSSRRAPRHGRSAP